MSTTNLIKELTSKNLIRPPFNPEGTQYLVITGSEAYAASNDHSDFDIAGWYIPEKTDVFPHLGGKVWGLDFPNPKETLKPWQKHHVYDQTAQGGAGRQYDFCIYHITRYFDLISEGNPNMVDTLFVPQRCIIHMTPVAELVREKRRLFLFKGCWKKFKNYAFSQLHKLKTAESDNRKALIDRYGYDTKKACHTVRLLNEIEQIMIEGDLDLEANREQLKAIRRGDWSEDEVKEYFDRKEVSLELLYASSKLREEPDYEAIKALLLQVLEIHFTNLKDCIETNVKAENTIKDIKQILVQNGYL